MRILPLLSLLSALAVAQPPNTPAALQPQNGQRLAFQAHGVGVQIYSCRSKNGQPAWVLEGPEAKLLDREGNTVGKHYLGRNPVGPVWQTSDGSTVSGKPVASVPAPDPGSVPWILLRAIKQEGAGLLSGVLSIQRLNTRGGKAPADGCTAAKKSRSTRVSYEADYYFYSASGPG